MANEPSVNFIMENDSNDVSVRCKNDDGDGRGENGDAPTTGQSKQLELAPDKSKIMSSPLSALVISSESKQNGKSFADNSANRNGSSVQENITCDAPTNACKRVRFSICEYITETLVHEAVDSSHANPAFENVSNKFIEQFFVNFPYKLKRVYPFSATRTRWGTASRKVQIRRVEEEAPSEDTLEGN